MSGGSSIWKGSFLARLRGNCSYHRRTSSGCTVLRRKDGSDKFSSRQPPHWLSADFAPRAYPAHRRMTSNNNLTQQFLATVAVIGHPSFWFWPLSQGKVRGIIQGFVRSASGRNGGAYSSAVRAGDS